jgi:hypothetical protein
MVKHIHNMLKKDRSFSRNDTTEKDSVEIKNAISFAPMSANLAFEKDFIIYTNATEEVIFSIIL